MRIPIVYMECTLYKNVEFEIQYISIIKCCS